MKYWLAGDELYGWAKDQITASQTDDLFDKSAVLAMLEEHRRGEAEHSRRLWTIISFMIWHGIFVEKRIDPGVERREYPVEI